MPVGRQSAAMLHAVGIPEFVASSEQEFVEIGCYWSQHRSQLTALQKDLRAQMASSSLTDAAAYAAGLEAHLQRIWQDYLSNLPAAEPAP